LDKLGLNLGYLLLQIFNFLILFVVLRVWVYKPILGLLERRREAIAKGLEDIRRGRTYGPFDTAEDAIKFLHKEIRARKGKDKRKTPQS